MFGQSLRLVLRGIVLGLSLFVAFVAGFFVHESLMPASSGLVMAEPGQYALLTEVHRLLEEHFLRDMPDDMTLEYAAIRGLVSQLNDRYTFFVDPPVAQSESDALAGQYGGIGVQVQHAADGRFVLYPFPDGPAARAGIVDGDILLAVDDLEVTPGERMDVVDQAMRGEVGEDRGVNVRLLKRETNAEVVYFVAFEVIEVPSVVWRPLVEDARIGYVQLLRFTSRTPEELHRALTELNADNIDAWILDVRDNPGGLLQESVQVADEFLDSGVILYERSRDSEEEFTATPGGLATEHPIVVLVNHGTASAAELVAGALQDQGRGYLIGQATYGKGSVQLIFPLSDGSSLHVTSTEWFTPNRTPLESNGLTPDVSMIPADDGRDVELNEAIHYLQQQF